MPPSHKPDHSSTTLILSTRITFYRLPGLPHAFSYSSNIPKETACAGTRLLYQANTHAVQISERNPLQINAFPLQYITENMQFPQNRFWYRFSGLLLHDFGAALPTLRIMLQPPWELLRRQDPDAGAVVLSMVAALKGRAEGRGVVDQKCRFQHILTVLQFQIIVVNKSVAATDVIDMFIDQHTGTELWEECFLIFPPDRIPKQTGEKSGAISICALRQHRRQELL